MNVDTAIAQSELNNVNQTTPYGTINYQQTGDWGVDPTTGQKIPRFASSTTLSPQMQNLFNSNISNAQGSSNLEGQLQNNVANTISKPIDLSWGATEQNLDQLNRNTLDPQWKQAQGDLNQQLADQGLTPGSEQWKYQQNQFGLNKANAYDQMFLQGHQTAVNDIQSQYNSPINTLSALRSGSQVQQPGVGQLAPTAQSGIQAPNYQGLVQSNYQAAMQAYQSQMQSSNAMMSGLFGLGGSLITGGAQMLSDRKAKTDIQKLGPDPKTGVMMYAYRYKGDPKSYPKSVGPLADEVEKAAPGSTRKVGGLMAIKPDAAAMFGLGGGVRRPHPAVPSKGVGPGVQVRPSRLANRPEKGRLPAPVQYTGRGFGIGGSPTPGASRRSA